MLELARAAWRSAAAVTAALVLGSPAWAQMATLAPPPVTGALPVTIERIKVRGPALDGNLSGEAVERDVLVVLPPSYAANPRKRYPVVYALHGYSVGAEQWSQELHLFQTAAGAFARGAREMIVVLPDSKTIHDGSMYSSSVTTGDFETFVARDLVDFIESRYRAVSDRRSRGLAGHSMGGYGVARIGMKHADVFGALYMMSPCCLSARSAGPGLAGSSAALAAVRSPEDSARLPFGLRAQLASAAAWSPNPKQPPLYLDLPVKDGVAQPDVLARWAANAPLAFVDQYVPALRSYRGIAIDVGDQDGLKADAGKLHDVLNAYGVQNSFEVYPGAHVSHVAFRFQDEVLPFFSRNLAFPEPR